MAHYTITSKNHDEWLRSRENGVGSSEVATLLGVNPYETPYQLWLKKTGRVQKVENETFLMKAGHYLEDAISHFCADSEDLEIVKSSAAEFVVVNKEKEFLRASPDRYAFPKDARHTNDNRLIIECKSTQKAVDPGNLSRYWFCQIQYQMGIAEIGGGYLAWLTQGREFGCKRLSFDPDFFGFMAGEVERFWTDNIVGDKEPPLSTVADVILKYPRQTEGKKVFASDELVGIWNELKDKDAEIKRLQSEKTELEDAMKSAMLDAETLAIPAGRDNPEKVIATWKAAKDSRRFDSEAFKAAEPEEYGRFLKTVPGSRRFIVK